VRGTVGRIPPEIQISLASLQAPRIARHPAATDEAFAFASREFLRKLAVGKVVNFKVEYSRTTAQGAERKFGSVFLPPPVGDVSKAVVGAGWARVVRGRDDQPRSSVHDDLLALEDGAEAAGKGLFNTDMSDPDTVRSITWDASNPTALLRTLQREGPQNAIVEGVRDGASLRCLLRPSNTMVNFSMAGVHVPRPGRAPKPGAASSSDSAASASASASSGAGGGSSGGGGGGGSGSAPDRSKDEPFSLDSRYFSESRLLNRELKLQFGGVDSYGNFFGKVMHPKGDIAAELLKAGLGRVHDRTIAHCPREQLPVLRSAEKQAKDARKGIWKDWAPRSVAGAAAFEARVVEVVSGDSVVVAVGRGAAAEEHRVFLASLRAPRLGRRGETPAPWAAHSKETLRRALIGRDVSVRVNYTRAPAEGMTGAAALPRKFATVLLTSSKGAVVNVGLQQVKEGLAEVIKHREDEDHADDYDALIMAEAEATEAKKGIHKGAAAGTGGGPRVNDLSTDTTRAKATLPALQRAKAFKAQVDHTFSGGRVKLVAPAQHAAFILALSGVRCPGTARAENVGRDGKKLPARAAEPFGAEAAAFMRQELYQRDVEAEVESCDARGVMLGQIWMTAGSARKLVAVELLRQGLARTIPPVAERSPYGAQLFAAEDEAKAARIGVWQGYEEAKEAEAHAEAGAEPLVNGTVIDILDGHTFVAHASRDEEALAKVTAAMAELGRKAGTSAAACDTKRGSVVSALFDDGSGPAWFRARVDGKAAGSGSAVAASSSGDAFKVTFVDYGNTDVATTSQMRPVPLAVASLPPLARVCRLAFVRADDPATSDYGHEAACMLSELILQKQVVMKVHGRDEDNRLLVSIFREGDKESIAEMLLRAGIIRISKTALRSIRKRVTSGAAGAETDNTIMTALREAQEEARKGRVAQWRFGDIGDSDDDERRR
jgi:staphylococcal nuclease domain-containing protein 1